MSDQHFSSSGECVGRSVLGLELGLDLPVRSKCIGMDSCPLGDQNLALHREQHAMLFHKSLFLLMYKRCSHITDMGVVQSFYPVSCPLAIKSYVLCLVKQNSS